MRGSFSGEAEDGEFFRRVIGEVQDLGPGDVLTIAECGPTHATRWEVRLDLLGTPRWITWPASWAELAGPDGALSPDKLAVLIEPATPGRLLLAQARLAGQVDGLAAAAAGQVAQLSRDAPVYRLARPADDLIRAAMRDVPLTQWYALAALRPRPDGTVVLTQQPLFPPTARRDDTRSFPIWVERSEDARTAFVVLAREDDADPPDWRVVSIESGSIPAGRYEVTALLVRPGRVRFEGLPEPLEADARGWAELRDAIPRRIPTSSPSHLVVAVELCGPQLLYARRIDCAIRLIQDVSEGARAPMRYSVIGYGSHAWVRMTEEAPIEELCWADNALMALAPLSRLRNRDALKDGSTLGAKLECALHYVAGRLAASSRPGERPVLVTIGTRPPFPPMQDATEALPCKEALDWRKTLSAMTERHDGIAFGAIYDGEPVADAWMRLGRDARGRPSGFAPWQFAASLGLLTPDVPAVPLPLTQDPASARRR